MKPTDGKPMDRRVFVSTALRRLALGVLGLTGYALLRKRPARGETCVNRGLCRGCGAYEGCGLPQALSAKSAGVRPDRDVVPPAGKR